MPSGKKNAILNPNVLWPKAKIPYVIAASFTSAQLQVIDLAINEYRNKTCIRFVPRTSEVNYIQIVKSGQGCWSYLGKICGGWMWRQDLSLDDGCASNLSQGTVLHELMHAIGFEHEHQRPDRDKYVSINFNNVEKKNRGPLEKQSTAQVTTLGLPYDYG
ncbi:astacin-like [Daphnia pulex]|uniref:astacin-like n=1 Tax=Daphnia pulex TaxID=6669 RepID=UPI001EDD4DAB|nr:astacin-like [Daphnia pulex]